MSTRRARPVITVVDARPMSEVGFSGTSFGQPSNNSNQLGSNVSSNRPSVANQSGNVVQPANNDCGRPPARMPPPRPQAPPISVAESTAKPKPEPKPRPRSMMIPKSTSLSVLNQELVSPQDRQAPHEKSEQLRKPPAAGRPTIIRPQVLRPSVGTNDSDVFDQQEMIATGADKKKPPVLKPKPSALLRHGSLTDLPAREAENNMMGGAGIAVDNARRKPTIIRPSPQVTGPSSQHPVATHRHVQAPATLADAKDSLKTVVPPLPSKQYADSSKAAEQADCCTNTVSEVANKQGRAKPTIIRMNKVPVLDSSVNFAVSGNSNAGSLQKEEKLDNQGNDQCGIQQTDICHLNSVSASSSTPEIENIKNHALEDTHCNKRIDASASCGVRPKLPPAAGKPPVGVASHISDMPHSQAEQHVHATHPVLEPVKSLPPTKPPPPRNAATRTTSHSVSAAESAKDPSSQRQESRRPPPPRPSLRPKEQIGSPPPLPARPVPGHPLYHYVCKGPHALALFDYPASQPDELSFQAGDIIMLEKWVNSEWIVGSTGNSHGMFPVNFVEIQEPLPCELDDRPFCIAAFDFAGESAEDLSFSVGDRIVLLAHVNSEWLRGSVHGREGIFPIAFVNVVKDVTDLPPRPKAATVERDLVPSSSQASASYAGVFSESRQLHAVALYDFDGDPSKGDLPFHAGDTIVDLTAVSEEWMSGRIGSQTGMFPTAFVNVTQ